MKQKVGERWTKAQALGQRINFPYCVMAKVKGSWLAARNRLQVSKEGLCPSLKAVLLTQEENDARCFFLLDSVNFLQCQKFRVKISISVWRRTVQRFALWKAWGSSWRSSSNTGLRTESRSEQSGEHVLRRRVGAPSQRQSRVLLKVREIERAQVQRGGTQRQSLGSIQSGEPVQSRDT